MSQKPLVFGFVLALTGVVALERQANASSAFTPQCVPGRVIPAPLDTNNGSWAQERSLNTPSKLSNNLSSWTNIWANGLTTGLSFNFANFQTEANYDLFKIVDNWGGPVTQISGPKGNYSTGSLNFVGLDQYGGTLGFMTDTSVLSDQVQLNSVTTTGCRLVNLVAPSKLLYQGQRNLGFLSGTDDVVYPDGTCQRV